MVEPSAWLGEFKYIIIVSEGSVVNTLNVVSHCDISVFHYKYNVYSNKYI